VRYKDTAIPRSLFITNNSTALLPFDLSTSNTNCKHFKMMLSTNIALVAAILSGQALGAALLARNETESIPGTPSTVAPLPETGIQAQTAFYVCKNSGFRDCTWFVQIQTGVCCKLLSIYFRNDRMLTQSQDDLPGDWDNSMSSARSEAGYQCIIFK
jgi:hypothetical protein